MNYTIKIQAANNFVLEDVIYENPFFLIYCTHYNDLELIIINNFMYSNYESFLVGNSYLKSFGMHLNSENSYNEELIFKKVVDYLLTISPNTSFILN